MESTHDMDVAVPGMSAIPVAARVATMALTMFTTITLSFCLTRRLQTIKNWRLLQVPQWLVLAIYTDSLLFIISTAILTKSFNFNSDVRVCDGAILLCIACYMSTKVLLYYFLVEKVFVIRNPWKSRWSDKLYMFNLLSVILPYVVLVILSFVYRIAYIDTSKRCVIGINKNILFPLTSFEAVLNIYLTCLFLHPLKKLYGDDSINTSEGGPKAALKSMAMRTFIGSCGTLVSTAVNLGVLAGLNGEKGWLCLMLCNLDILFAVSVLHWATSLDKSAEEDAPRGNAYMPDGTEFRTEVTQRGLKSMNRGSISRRGSTWEEMELNEIDFDFEKLGGIREEVIEKNVDPKDQV